MLDEVKDRAKGKYRVGARFMSNLGGEFEIVQKIDSERSLVKFLDEHGYSVVVQHCSIRSGFVKNLYAPALFGVGYFGVGEYKCRHGSAADGAMQTPEYNAWLNMLQRCYYSKYVSRVEGAECYDDVIVCDEWLNFQNFAKWWVEKSNLCRSLGIKANLEKDIFADKGVTKVYSPSTCCVVPSEINAFFIGESRVKKSGLPVCITKMGPKFSITAMNGVQYNLKFNTLDEAITAKYRLKQQMLNELVHKYIHVLEDRVVERLLSYYN
jgi:hypothetical protein